MEDPYEILELSPTADWETVRRQYRRLVRLYHPDQFQHPDDKRYAEDELIRVNTAFQQLQNRFNPNQRAQPHQQAPFGDSLASVPKPIILPANLDFGRMAQGEKRIGEVRLSNMGAPAFQVNVRYSDVSGWFRAVRLVPVHAVQTFPASLYVQVDTTALEVDCTHCGTIVVDLDGTTAELTLNVDVVAPAPAVSLSRRAPRWVLAPLLVVLLALAGTALYRFLPTGTAFVAGGSAAAPSEELLFSLYLDNEMRLYTSQIGGGEQQLLNRSGRSPVWSPDGEQIAFLSESNGDSQIFVYEETIAAVRQVTHLPGEKVDLAWSPDGNQIAFLSPGTTATLQIVDLNSGAVKPVVQVDGGAIPTFSWLPDGNGLIYEVERGEISTVERVDLVAEEIQSLFNFESSEPAPSPDGERIAAASSRGLYISNPQGQELRRLTTEAASRPAWSPDGERIAFGSTSNGARESLWIVDADGRNARQLTDFSCIEFVWAPDGQKIGCISGNPQGEPPVLYLWIVEPEGETTLLAEVNEAHLSWKP